DPARVWEAIPHVVRAGLGRRRSRALARVLGCRDRGGPEPFAAVEGATAPGFRATRVVPPREIELEGRHRFARYALTFRVVPRPGGATLSAETRAEFPGLRGKLYRALVVGSGGHVIVTRRILGGIARRAERSYK
ncbi:MAG TPA: hypothetical protein VM778_08905, partial [Gemmatimonadota bacterium]|nr:hypothetical protein [Gemmatimonadota bacterium]